MNKKLMLVGLIAVALIVSTVSGAFLTYKGFVEIYGSKYPLGEVELETWGLKPIEGLEAGTQHIGEICIWTYSPDSEVILQLMQLSRIVTNFRSFTVKVCLPLDVIYVVDLTASMDPDFETIKRELIELTAVLWMMNECPVQVAVVGFKDFPGETIWKDFVTLETEADYNEVVGYIAGLTATGGGPIPQSHYLGFEKALELFHGKDGSWKNDRIIVFTSDAESGFANNPELAHSIAAITALEAEGIKVHSVLCGDPTDQPERDQLMWYADFTGGNFIDDPERLVPGVTKDPTWIVKLTPITPFDSFRFKLANSGENANLEICHKGEPYRLSIFVDYFCKAVPWHEFFVCELAAHLEHAETPPYFPPPPEEEIEWPIEIRLRIDPTKVNVPGDSTMSWTVDPGGTTPVRVTFRLFDPDGNLVHEIIQDPPPDPIEGSYTHSFTAADVGKWSCTVLYEYDGATPGSMFTGGQVNVDP